MRKIIESIMLVIFQCIAVSAVFMGLLLLLKLVAASLPIMMGINLGGGLTLATLLVTAIVFASVIIGIQLMGRSSARASAMRTLPFPTGKTWRMTTFFTLLGAILGYVLSLSAPFAIPDYLDISSYVPLGTLVGGLLGYHIWSLSTIRQDHTATAMAGAA